MLVKLLNITPLPGFFLQINASVVARSSNNRITLVTVQRLNSTKSRKKSNSSYASPSLKSIADRVKTGVAFEGFFFSGFVIHPVSGLRVNIGNANRKSAIHGDWVVVLPHPPGDWKVSRACPLYQTLSVNADVDKPPVTANVADNGIEPTADDPSDLEAASQVDQSPSLEVEEEGDRLVPFTRLLSLTTLLESLPQSADDLSQLLPLTLSLPIHNQEDLGKRLNNFTTHSFGRDLLPTGEIIAVTRVNPNNVKQIGPLFELAAFLPDKSKDLPVKWYSHSLLVRFASRLSEGDLAKWLVLVPTSSRTPPVLVRRPDDDNQLSTDILNKISLGQSVNCICRITDWDENSRLHTGVLCDNELDTDLLAAATQSTMIEHGIEDRAFTDEHLVGLTDRPEDFVIPHSEYAKRRDFRSCCIFSIDPPSAKDIDDALHIKELGPDMYEVGVHIADVSYFVRPGTALNNEASYRTSSVYFVQKVIPMLPPILSEHLCSLKPFSDKLAFSVVMKVRKSGEIVSASFHKSIIRSRACLSYDQAQTLLDSTSSSPKDDLLPSPESPFTRGDLERSLLALNQLALRMRLARFEAGSLNLDTIEFEFDLPDESSQLLSNTVEKTDDESTSSVSSWPRGFKAKSRTASSKLIEEWMLAANQSVARFLFSTDPSLPAAASTASSRAKGASSWLRRHPEPSRDKLKGLVDLCAHGDIKLDVESSRSISESLELFERKLDQRDSGDVEKSTLVNVLSILLSMRMRLAKYFNLDALLQACPSLAKQTRPTANQLLTPTGQLREATWHYGLSVPLYTHFTSPIRRYADLQVHRQLAARLLSTPPPQSMVARRQATLEPAWCNERRVALRKAQLANQRQFVIACIKSLSTSSQLPEDVSDWNRINQISLGSNCLTHLPNSISSWTNVTKLRLDDNLIKSLSPSINSMSSLTSLDLANNQLEQLPADLGGLTSLRELNLTCNRLVKLPPSIAAGESSSPASSPSSSSSSREPSPSRNQPEWGYSNLVNESTVPFDTGNCKVTGPTRVKAIITELSKGSITLHLAKFELSITVPLTSFLQLAATNWSVNRGKINTTTTTNSSSMSPQLPSLIVNPKLNTGSVDRSDAPSASPPDPIILKLLSSVDCLVSCKKNELALQVHLDPDSSFYATPFVDPSNVGTAATAVNTTTTATNMEHRSSSRIVDDGLIAI